MRLFKSCIDHWKLLSLDVIKLLMSITIQIEENLEKRLRQRAAAEGTSDMAATGTPLNFAIVAKVCRAV